MSLPRVSLTRRFAVAFAVVAAFTMLLAGVILAYTWAGQFDRYVAENLQETSDGAAQLLAHAYSQSEGWSIQALAQMPRFGMMSGLALQVLDAEGNVIYDDVAFFSLSGKITGVPQGYREPDGPVVTSPVVVDDDVVGIVRVWSLSPQGMMSENDVRFRTSSFVALAATAVVAVLLASLAGMVFSLTLVRPLDHITTTAAALRLGDRQARTGLGGDDAIGVLGRTFDEMADAIEADREMERRLTADVAHELRTPLQAIQATVEAMQDGVMPADEEHLGIVREETRRLSRMADGILELTRLERGSTPMHLQPLDLSTVVRTAIDAHGALVESAGLTITSDVADRVMVDGDRDRLTQAIGNLLANAVRYTPEGGLVHVALRTEFDRAVVEVADTGIGISPQDLGSVFGRFWRADDARDRSSGGLGIGLAIVKEIVERHGGTIGGASREGGGTVFSMRLPLRSRV